MNPWTDSFEQYRQDILGENKKKSDKKSSDRWQDDDGDNDWYEKSDVDGKISDREKKEKEKNSKKEVKEEGIADIIARLEKKRISKGGDPKDSPLPSMKKYHEKKKKKVKEEVVTEKISASGYARAKKWREAQAAQKDREDNAKWEEKARTHKWDGKTWNKRDKPTHEEGQGPHAKKLAAHNAKNESVEVNHIDGSKTQIIDVIRAPKMPSAAPLGEISGDGVRLGIVGGIATGGAALIKNTIDAAGRLKEKMKKRTQVGEKYSNWREDFIWEGPATAKDPKLDVKETGVKNKIEVNPEVKTEEKKKLTKTAPLSDRVHNWSKTKCEELELEDYHRGQGEKKQKRTLQWLKDRAKPGEDVGAPGLDAYKERQKEHEDRRNKKKKVSEGSTWGVWKGDGKRKLPGDKKKKVDEGKKKKDDTYLETDWEKRKENNEKARKDLQKGPQMKNPHLEGVKYYSGKDRDEKTGYPKGLKSSGGSKKEKPMTGVDYTNIQASYEPRFSVFDEAADRKMSRATDQQLADAHKKFSGMDQSSPANAHMTKRITREITRRRKAAKATQGTSPVKEEVGVSSSASITKAKQEAELQRKEALAKKKKGVKEHHQKDSNGKVIEHGDGTPSSVEENVVKKVFDKAKEVWNRPIMAPTITKDEHLKKIRKSGGDTSHWEETEVVSELNRYEKETGKSSGSLNMPKGRKTKKGGDSSELMRNVRTSIRRETGKPSGQRKTRKKGEKTPDMKGPSAKLQKSISKLKAKRELEAKAKKAGYTNTQDYIEVQARYPD